ncbi:MAG: CRISPR-associated RAMP protein, partial [Thermoprotei archaeon]
MVFERLNRRLIFEGHIKALTPLHVGSGRPELAKEERGIDLPVIRNVDGVPYIPGSSIKGRVRSEAERIARSAGYDICNPPDTDQMCGTLKRREEELCIICRIFGTAGRNISRASKVRFRDALMMGDIPPGEMRMEIRTGIALDRERGSVYRGALYTVEAVPAGSKFKLEMVADNLTDEELKL